MKPRIADKRIGTDVLPINQVALLENYRTNFSMPDIEELASSINEVGQIQPVIVNLVDDEYQLVAGQRRYYAIHHLNLDTIKSVVYENLTPEEVSIIQLSENIKKAYNPAEKAGAIPNAKNLVENIKGQTFSKAEFSREMKFSPTRVGNAFNYDNLEECIKDAVENKQITYSIGVQLGRLEKEKQLEKFDEVIRIKQRGDRINSKQLAKNITAIIKTKARPDELILTGGEQLPDEHVPGLIKKYRACFNQAASALRGLTLMLKEKDGFRDALLGAEYHGLNLYKLATKIPEHIDSLETKLEEYNQEGFENALYPKRKKHILDLILKEKKVKGKDKTAKELIKEAQEQEIDINRIYSDTEQPRKTERRDGKQTSYLQDYENYLNNLAANIAEVGVLTPIIIVKRKSEKGDYRIVDGESRWRTSKKAGLQKIPSIPTELDDLSCRIIQLEADIYRKDSPIERAQALDQIKDYRKSEGVYSKEDFAKEIQAFMGMKPDEVRKYMILLDLDTYTKDRIFHTKEISFTAGLELARIEKAKQRKELANVVIAGGLILREVKRLVDNTILSDKFYRAVKGKEKEFIDECAKAGEHFAERKIIDSTIEYLAAADQRLRNLPSEEKFFKDNRVAQSYAFFKKSLKDFNQAM